MEALIRPILSILVVDEPAAHERLVNVLRRRGSAVVSLSVAQAEPGMARFTVSLDGDLAEANQLRLHVEKMVDVVEATVPESDGYHGVETAVLRLRFSDAAQAAAGEAIFRRGGRVLKLGSEELVGVLSDRPDRVEAAIAALARLGPITTMRTGVMAMLA